MGTFVQDTTGDSTGSGTAATLASTSLTGVGSGNILIAYAVCYAASNTITFSDDNSNTWNEGTALTADGSTMRMGYAMNVNSGDTVVTANFSPNAGYRGIYVMERSGIATTSALDDESSQQETTGTSRSSGTMTSTGDGDLVGLCYKLAWDASPTAGAGMTDRGELLDFTFGTDTTRVVEASYTGSGTQEALFGVASNTTHSIAMLFLDAVAGGATPKNLTLLGVG